MSTKNDKEAAIVIFVGSETTENKIVSYVEKSMGNLFPSTLYMFVCIENEDNIAKLLSPFDPQVFIFDIDRKFIKDGREYDACEIAYRLCDRHRRSFALLMTRGEVQDKWQAHEKKVQERVLWAADLIDEKKSMIFFVEEALKKAFGGS